MLGPPRANELEFEHKGSEERSDLGTCISMRQVSLRRTLVTCSYERRAFSPPHARAACLFPGCGEAIAVNVRIWKTSHATKCVRARCRRSSVSASACWRIRFGRLSHSARRRSGRSPHCPIPRILSLESRTVTMRIARRFRSKRSRLYHSCRCYQSSSSDTVTNVVPPKARSQVTSWRRAKDQNDADMLSADASSSLKSSPNQRDEQSAHEQE